MEWVITSMYVEDPCTLLFQMGADLLHKFGFWLFHESMLPQVKAIVEGDGGEGEAPPSTFDSLDADPVVDSHEPTDSITQPLNLSMKVIQRCHCRHSQFTLRFRT